jgi:hypothetical protein
MKKKTNDQILSELITEGNKYSFENNSYYTYGEAFSRSTTDFLSWISKVENYILSNYDESSGPYKMLISVDRSKFSGYYEYEFEPELTKLKGAIKSCKNLAPNKLKSSNPIIDLIKNPIFWTVLVFVGGASYKFGFDNGNTKYESEKIELSEKNKVLKDSLTQSKVNLKILKSMQNKIPTNDSITNIIVALRISCNLFFQPHHLKH